MMDDTALELAERVDLTSGKAIFADPKDGRYPLPERVLSKLIKER